MPVGAGQVALNGWVKVAPDDSVTVLMSKSEIGRGVHTGLVLPLRYASVTMCPTLGGTVARFDAASAIKLPGVVKAPWPSARTIDNPEIDDHG